MVANDDDDDGGGDIRAKSGHFQDGLRCIIPFLERTPRSRWLTHAITGQWQMQNPERQCVRYVVLHSSGILPLVGSLACDVCNTHDFHGSAHSQSRPIFSLAVGESE